MTPRVDTVPGRHGMLLVSILGGMFLAMLDQNIVGTALPHMVRDLGGAQLYTWVVSAYLLASTVTLPLYGRLADLYGYRRLLLVGLVLFLAGSALCAVAGTMVELVAFRAVQGLGAGALMPISLALVADMFRTGRAGRLSAMIGITMALAYATGPVLGGVFADYASWRWVFLVNLPLTALIIAMTLLTLRPAPPPAVRPRPDYLGILVFSVAMVGILVGLTEKGLAGQADTSNAWSAPVVLWPLVAGVVALAVFLVIETRHPDPLIPLGFFRSGQYSVVNIVSFCSAFGLYTSVIFLPRYLQTVQGFDATESGLLIYPLLLGLVISNFVAGAVIGRTRRYKALILVALCGLAIGCGLVALIRPHSSDLLLSAGMLLIGAGLGPTLAGLIVIIQDVVPPEHTGAASAALTFSRQIGGTLALTIGGTLFLQRVQAFPGGASTPDAVASATALVIPVVGGVGALICVLAFATQPAWPLWSGKPKIDPGPAARAAAEEVETS